MVQSAFDNVAVVQSIPPQVLTDGTVNGTGVEVADANGALAVINAGGWTDGTHTLTLQESDVLASGYTAVAAADLELVSAAPGATHPLVIDGAGDDDVVYVVGYKGIKKFIRVIVVTASSTTGAILGVAIVKYNVNQIPAN